MLYFFFLITDNTAGFIPGRHKRNLRCIYIDGNFIKIIVHFIGICYIGNRAKFTEIPTAGCHPNCKNNQPKCNEHCCGNQPFFSCFTHFAASFPTNKDFIPKAIFFVSNTIPPVAALQPKNRKIARPAQRIPAPSTATPANPFP